MAVVTINKKQFEKEIGKLDEAMQNKIAMFGTPVEEINESEIQIEVFPNRPDILSYQGFKRAEAEIAVPNKASVKIAQKTGFKIEGRKEKSFLLDNGKYVDGYIVGKVLR